MPSLNFKGEFAKMVASGEKRQTIRALRKRPILLPGDTLHLFTGLRTKQSRRLIEPVVCIGTVPIVLARLFVTIDLVEHEWDDALVDMLAYRDGFRSGEEDATTPAEQLWLFFQDRFPFMAQIIYW